MTKTFFGNVLQIRLGQAFAALWFARDFSGADVFGRGLITRCGAQPIRNCEELFGQRGSDEYFKNYFAGRSS